MVPVVVRNLQSGGTSNPLFLTVGNPPKITTTSLPAGQAGASYSAPLSVTGGVPPYRWSSGSSNLPAGLAINQPNRHDFWNGYDFRGLYR